jgi:hypothetical protein
LGLNAVLAKHITPNTFNLSARNLASDDYASKHLFKLEHFDDEFERITVNQLSDMAEQYQSGKTKKVIKQIKELVNLK